MKVHLQNGNNDDQEIYGCFCGSLDHTMSVWYLGKPKEEDPDDEDVIYVSMFIIGWRNIFQRIKVSSLFLFRNTQKDSPLSGISLRHQDILRFYNFLGKQTETEIDTTDFYLVNNKDDHSIYNIKYSFETYTHPTTQDISPEFDVDIYFKNNLSFLQRLKIACQYVLNRLPKFKSYEMFDLTPLDSQCIKGVICRYLNLANQAER